MTLVLLLLCVLLVVASLVGGWLPATVRMTHLRLQITLSFVAGVMLGVATTHLLPHSTVLLGSVDLAMAVALVGILFMFFLNRIFHFHQHEVVEANETSESPREVFIECSQHDCDAHPEHLHGRDISSIGLFVGMTIHTLIDGVALAAAVSSDGQGHFSVAGVSVFLAILLHKPLDSMSITSLMRARGWKMSTITGANLIFAFLAPLGAILFALGIAKAGVAESFYVGLALAFSAGAFLCISLGDLLPEVHYHQHHRIWLSSALLAGIALAVGIELVPGHSHEAPQHSTPTAGAAAER